MPKYYKKKYYYPGSRDKYSVEHNGFSLTTNSTGDAGQTVVPASTTQGMRKVKHLTVSVASNSTSQPYPLWWAIVYVPQGTTANTLQIDSGTLYEPNQFVMGCGVFDFDGGPLRVKCPLSRNLNSGDTIAFILHSTAANVIYNCCLSYAITLQ